MGANQERKENGYMKKGIVYIIFAFVSLHLSAQDVLFPDSMVLRTIEGKNMNKQVSEYNAQGQEIVRAYYVWNDSRNKWDDYMKYSYGFDSSGNQNFETLFMMDSVLGGWKGIHKHQSWFDEDGNETKKLYYGWDMDSNDWTTNYRHETEFDEKGNRLEDVSYFGHQNGWVKYEYNNYKYKYDDSGNLIRTLKFELDSEDMGTYMNAKYKYEYEYDDLGNLIASDFSERVDEYQWMPRNRYEYEYDEDGNQILETHYFGEDDYNDWQEHYKYGHSYDEYGQLAGMFFYYWNEDEQDWIGKYNYKYYYDENGNPSYIDLYIWEDGDWVYNEKAVYYYSGQEIFTSTRQLVEEWNVSVFPNPVSNFLTVSGAGQSNMSVADSQGRLLYSKKDISDRETIQTASWVTGIYFVRLQKDNKSITRKVLKQ